MSLLPLARGRRWPSGRMRGLTWSSSDEPENSGLFPLTLTLSPRGKRVQMENQLRGRGDNRKKIHNIISNRVKYSRNRWSMPSPVRLSNRNASEELWLMPDEPAWGPMINGLT